MNWRKGYSPPGIGGVAAPLTKRREATSAAQTGWSRLRKPFKMRFLQRVLLPTTPSAPSKEATQLLLDVASTPPVSGACPSNGQSAVGAVYETVNEPKIGEQNYPTVAIQ